MSDQPPVPLVLIVEDEPLVRAVMVDALQEEGFRTVEAGNVAEAVLVLEAQPGISVVVTDVEMPPGARGHELAAQAKEDWPHLRFVVTSGRVWPGAGELPDSAVFLPKPWTGETLAQCVWEAVARARVALRR